MEEYEFDFEIPEDAKKIKIEDENGVEKEYEVIAYVSTEDGDFLAYTDNTELENGQILIYVNSIIQEEDGSITLDEVEEDEVLKIANEIRGRM